MTHRKLIEQMLFDLLAAQEKIEGEWNMGRTNEEIEEEGDTWPSITAAREYLAQPEQSEPDWKKPPEYVPPLVKWAQEQTARKAP